MEITNCKKPSDLSHLEIENNLFLSIYLLWAFYITLLVDDVISLAIFQTLTFHCEVFAPLSFVLSFLTAYFYPYHIQIVFFIAPLCISFFYFSLSAVRKHN